MAIAEGTFEIVSGGEDAYHEKDGDVRLTHAHGAQLFSGGIEGDGSIQWLMCYLPNGGARFVGLQRIEGAVGGRRGSFIIEAVGTHDGRESRATWHIVDGSGAGELIGMTGDGGFHAPGGRTASYHLEYELG